MRVPAKNTMTVSLRYLLRRKLIRSGIITPALAIRKISLSSAYPCRAVALNNLAVLCSVDGCFADESLTRRSLAMVEKRFAHMGMHIIGEQSRELPLMPRVPVGGRCRTLSLRIK